MSTKIRLGTEGDFWTIPMHYSQLPQCITNKNKIYYMVGWSLTMPHKHDYIFYREVKKTKTIDDLKGIPG